MKKIAVILLSLLLTVMLFACNETPTPDTATPTPTVENTPTTAPTSEPTPGVPAVAGDGHDQNYDDIAANNVSISSDLLEVRKSLGWWDNYTRFTTVEDVQRAFFMSADATSGGGGHEGAGSEFFRRESTPLWEKACSSFHELGIKTQAWLECQGDTGAYIIGLHQNEDGTFLMDENTGNAKILANPWSWDAQGPGVNAEVNYVTWAGLFTFVNDEPWSPASSTDALGIGKPTYPDGTLAIGYKDGDTSPYGSKFLDACAAKNINGRFIKYDGLELVGTSTEGAWQVTDEFGRTYDVTAISCGKDSCAPYWLEYSETVMREKIEIGVDWFWIDNWCGWDNICNRPLERGFGTWSEYKFGVYVNENEKFGINDPDFSITDYLKQKALEFDKEATLEEIELMFNSRAWNVDEWLEEPIWMAYLAFKSRANTEYNTAFHNLIKDLAEEINGDRESVASCANDFPYLTYGALSCDNLDVIHTEYNSNYSAGTGFTTTGYLPNAYDGHAFNLCSDMARANWAVFWYYPTDYAFTDTFTKVMGYQALAYNCSLYAGAGGATGTTEKGSTKVFETIGSLKEAFSDRRTYADIGVVFSAESELSWLKPGGYTEANEHTVAYMGWCHLFDELNVPYRSIYEDRLADRIDLCSVVILPNIRAIAPETVESVLIPYLDSGKTLVITGEYAGKMSTTDHDFEKNPSNILVDLANNYSGAGKVIYIEKDPLEQYFKLEKSGDSEATLEMVAETVDMIKGWHNDGTATTLLTMHNLDDVASVVTTLHYAPTANNYFLDIVNLQYDCETDTLTPLPETLECTLRLPSQLWGKQLKVSLTTSDTKKATVLEAGTHFTVEGCNVKLNIPSFDVYGCVVIEEANK